VKVIHLCDTLLHRFRRSILWFHPSRQRPKK
jgi:hypothetical protein